MGSTDDAETLTMKKFKGDLAYRRQEYQVELNICNVALFEIGSCSISYSLLK